MEAITINQTEIYDALVKFLTNFKKDGADRKTMDYCKRKLELLENYWRDYQRNHRKCCEISEFDHVYFTESCYDKAEEVYLSAKQLITKTMELLLSKQQGVRQLPQLPQEAGVSNRTENASRSQANQQQDNAKSAERVDKLGDMIKKQTINFRAFKRTVATIEVEKLQNKWEFEDALKCLQSRWVRCRKCYASHNTLLHEGIMMKNQSNTSAKSYHKATTTPTNFRAAKNEHASTHVSQNDITETLLSTAIVKITGADGTQHTMRALIDQGSQISIISEHAAQILKLKRNKCKGTIFGIGEKENNCKGVMKLRIQSIYSDFAIEGETLIMKKTETENEPIKPKTNNAEPEAGSSRHTGSPAHPRIVNIALALLMFISIITPTTASFNYKQLNSNQTLYFDPLGKMQLIRDKWKLVTYYDMSPYWQGDKAVKDFTNYLEKTCETIKEPSHCHMILLQIRHDYNELQYYNQLLLSQHYNTRMRTRRGLINAVGSIANSLFGVLDESFAEKYKQDIELVHRNQNHLAELWKNQTSIVEAEHNILQRTEAMIEKQHKIINRHLHDLDLATSNIQKEIDVMTMHQDFTFSQLEYRELQIIYGQMPKDLVLPIDNVESDLQHIYKLLKTKAKANQIELASNILIPDLDQINHIVKIKIPSDEESPNDILERQGLNKSLSILGEQIKDLKSSKAEIDNISYHDIHHYTIGYILLTIAISGAAVWIWRRYCSLPTRRGGGEACQRQESTATAPKTISDVYSEVQPRMQTTADRQLSDNEQIGLSSFLAKRWPSTMRKKANTNRSTLPIPRKERVVTIEDSLV
ncbi:hypothetical protein SFRURICE_014993 [Spodoptera frugiperda]|nr:hypothetical protein SFRURICE_014993 [Spodoptera frugiperda]